MSENHEHPNYIKIWVVLMVLTVLEVAVAFLPGEKYLGHVDGIHLIAIVLLLGMAFVKAGLVAAYFMHLKFEQKNFVMIVSFPLVLACVLVILLLPDVAFAPAA
jgi:cytochrome c oxidase subunit 4